MRPSYQKAAHLEPRSHVSEFAAVVTSTLPHIGRRTELMGLYLLVCMLWGLVVYAALAFAIP